MPLTRHAAAAIAQLCHELRPRWDTPGILAALKRYAHDPRHTAVIAQAFIRAAIDTGPDGAQTPAAVHARPSYWNPDHDTDPPRPRLTPEHECNRHPGQWAGTCSPCAGERLAPVDEPPLEPVSHVHDPAAYFRAEARRAARAKRAQWEADHPDDGPALPARTYRTDDDVIHVVTDANPEPIRTLPTHNQPHDQESSDE